MKCSICGYDDNGTGDSAHSCGTSFFMKSSAPMGTNGEAIPLPKLPKLTRWTFDGGMFAQITADGQWVKFTDIAPYAERIRHLERELELSKAAFIGSENARKDAERAWKQSTD